MRHVGDSYSGSINALNKATFALQLDYETLAPLVFIGNYSHAKRKLNEEPHLPFHTNLRAANDARLSRDNEMAYMCKYLLLIERAEYRLKSVRSTRDVI